MKNRAASYRLTANQITAFGDYLRTEEREQSTIEKYLHNIRVFAAWLGGAPVTKPSVIAWKEHLIAEQYAPTTVNAALASLNAFFKFTGWEECRVRALRIQRRVFRDPNRELTRDEYDLLVSAAYENGKNRLGLLMETICATGIRVSEVKYITVETAQRGKAEISLKGKIRTIMLPGKLCRKLLKYAKKQNIVSGEIFLTRNGKGLSRRQIWAEMKAVCKAAKVSPTKVFPHNLRHLFATVYYRVYRDIVKLADILGHSNIGTTRIYLLTTGAEHAEQLDSLNLIC